MKNTTNHDDMFWTMKTIKNKDKRKEFWEKEEEKFAEENKKWEFCVTLRPPFIWNFFGEEEEKLDHLINAEANPEICYKFEENNRVWWIFETCTDLGTHLTMYAQADWQKLVEHVIKIFDAQFEEYKRETKTFEQFN